MKSKTNYFKKRENEYSDILSEILVDVLNSLCDEIGTGP